MRNGGPIENAVPSRVALIGGGVIGAFTAYELARRGRQVTLIEKGDFGRGSSWGNCGIVLPTTATTLNTVGNVVSALRWMFKKDAPLYIRPRYDLDLFSWLRQFLRRCNRKDRHRAVVAAAALLKGATDAYAEIVRNEEMQCEWQTKGVLHLFRSAADFKKYETVGELAGHWGSGYTAIEPNALAKIEPNVNSTVAGAWMDQSAAHLRTDFLMAAFRRVLEKYGVSILENTSFQNFRVENGRVAAADTSRGEIRADAFVVTAGAWTPLLSDALGFKIPIQPGKGYSVTFSGITGALIRPCFFEEARAVATPWPSGLRLGGMLEFSGFDERVRRIRIEALLKAAKNHLRIRDFGQVEETWCGWRPMTFDGLPVIDRLPHLKNALVAAGHNMLGISMAPATGRLVAEMICGDPPHIDPAPYGLARFK